LTEASGLIGVAWQLAGSHRESELGWGPWPEPWSLLDEAGLRPETLWACGQFP